MREIHEKSSHLFLCISFLTKKTVKFNLERKKSLLSDRQGFTVGKEGSIKNSFYPIVSWAEASSHSFSKELKIACAMPSIMRSPV